MVKVALHQVISQLLGVSHIIPHCGLPLAMKRYKSAQFSEVGMPSVAVPWYKIPFSLHDYFWHTSVPVDAVIYSSVLNRIPFPLRNPPLRWIFTLTRRLSFMNHYFLPQGEADGEKPRKKQV